MVKTLALLVLAATALLLAYAASRPDTFRVERHALIPAPIEQVYPLISDLRRFNTWNPYALKDASIQIAYRGPASGVGAAYDFHGNQNVGRGSISLTGLQPPTSVTMLLDMLEPFEGHNTLSFTLTPQGQATDVRWAMNGASPFIARLMGLFFNMDQMIGRDFEAGLANLRALVERPVATP